MKIIKIKTKNILAKTKILEIERKFPYTHRDYDKIWQDVAAKDTLKSLGRMSDKESNYYKNL